MKFMGINYDGICSCKSHDNPDPRPLEEPTEEQMRQLGADIQEFFARRHLIGANDIAWSLKILFLMSISLFFIATSYFIIAFRQASISMALYAIEMFILFCIGDVAIRQYNKWKRTFYCKSCNAWRW